MKIVLFAIFVVGISMAVYCGKLYEKHLNYVCFWFFIKSVHRLYAKISWKRV